MKEHPILPVSHTVYSLPARAHVFCSGVRCRLPEKVRAAIAVAAAIATRDAHTPLPRDVLAVYRLCKQKALIRHRISKTPSLT
jgi:hypothetical protein